VREPSAVTSAAWVDHGREVLLDPQRYCIYGKTMFFVLILIKPTSSSNCGSGCSYKSLTEGKYDSTFN
jgi:hypothetical protein